MDQLLTEERVIFDAIGIDPVRTADREQRVGRSTRRTDRASASHRREVRLQVERTRSAR